MLDLLKHWRMVLTFALLYLSQGICFGVAMDALPTLLRHDGAALGALAFLPLVGLPWVVKFIWAPPVDNHWSPRLGRRRSWIVPMQLLVLLCLVSLAGIGLSVDTAGLAVGLLIVASLASATQDIATDGMAAEYFSDNMLARVNAIQVGGTMAGFFIGGAGALILSGYLGQTAAFGVLALVPLASLCCVAWLHVAPAVEKPADVAHASLLRFIRRPKALSLVLLALLSAMTSVSGFGLSKLFLNDAGWSLQAIGQLGMSGGVVTIVLGCGGGAWLIRVLGLWPAFMLAVAVAGLAALVWLLQASGVLATQVGLIWLAVGLGSFATGATSVAIMTAAMAFAGQSDQAGTDMTAVQSTRDLGEMLASSMLLALTVQAGYSGGFLAGAVMALVALLVAFNLAQGAVGQGMQARCRMLPDTRGEG
ncbi:MULTISPECIES: RhtX/FptX family siderophore transporter [unclassified Pseudomonas]|uniref:RhtX/FptX family siderophore transporter n=1 Tax=unclassified Pseudomonas TaxID=196821 RepID=UPI00244A7D3B|nr:MULTISPECIES: RhtX/FptX family siderophore transporter [unclassified Pseudomonas]MDH0303290.1 RhtX/FptX family siderophore transporter [Pseudomonas sp. GD04091]MDH1985314.1 RhtX/FptX family siderophore transporter [Pseudomonas sp. GD03689]